MHRFM